MYFFLFSVFVSPQKEHAVRMEELAEQLKSLEEEASAYRQEKALQDAADAGDVEDDLDAVLADTDLSHAEGGKSKKGGKSTTASAPNAASMNKFAPAMLFLQPLTLEQVHPSPFIYTLCSCDCIAITVFFFFTFMCVCMCADG